MINVSIQADSPQALYEWMADMIRAQGGQVVLPVFRGAADPAQGTQAAAKIDPPAKTADNNNNNSSQEVKATSKPTQATNTPTQRQAMQAIVRATRAAGQQKVTAALKQITGNTSLQGHIPTDRAQAIVDAMEGLINDTASCNITG